MSVVKTNVQVAQSNKDDLSWALCQEMVELLAKPLRVQPFVCIAMSGGSLPPMLGNLPAAFQNAKINPNWNKWHILLVDERCVHHTHDESNLKAIQDAFLNLETVDIPTSQVYGIQQDVLLDEPLDMDAQSILIAKEYEKTLVHVLKTVATNGLLDLCLLGFGPDGHTCSLFPHDDTSLQESTRLVIPILDSPKKPTHRITMTFPVLNQYTRHVLFCGAGASKKPILQLIWNQLEPTTTPPTTTTKKTSSEALPIQHYTATYSQPPPYPCAMVTPLLSLTWMIDSTAFPNSICEHENSEEHVESITSATNVAHVLVVPNNTKEKDLLAKTLCREMIVMIQKALQTRGVVSMALSGGSLPKLLGTLATVLNDETTWNIHSSQTFQQWHVLLADERCVPEDNVDSNLRALKQSMHILNHVPQSHIHGMDQISLGESPQSAAQEYEQQLRSVLDTCHGYLDLAVLGMGPDGHTCSLFPGHELLSSQKLVAAITDSPKLPRNRITLTLPTLNERTRTVLFCGSGESKSLVLKHLFHYTLEPIDDDYYYYYNDSNDDDNNNKDNNSNNNDNDNDDNKNQTPNTKTKIKTKSIRHSSMVKKYRAQVQPAYPCGMIKPQDRLVYIIDEAAACQLRTNPNQQPFEQWAKVLVAPYSNDVSRRLTTVLVQQCQHAMKDRGVFTIALSGGSLPGFLSSTAKKFQDLGVDPHWDQWHVLLADERCVHKTHADSNLGAIEHYFLSSQHGVKIPSSNVFGIDESYLERNNNNNEDDDTTTNSTLLIANDYENKVKQVLSKSGGMLDLAVLGFGPDGHTCSLFPDHPLLKEETKWVAPIEDSPKPPSKRITLTFPVLNQYTRNVVFCGAGSSKEPILKKVFGQKFQVPMGGDWVVPIENNPPPFPCAMVKPKESLIWIVDQDAMPKKQK